VKAQNTRFKIAGATNFAGEISDIQVSFFMIFQIHIITESFSTSLKITDQIFLGVNGSDMLP
jgi:hypothetical protein